MAITPAEQATFDSITAQFTTNGHALSEPSSLLRRPPLGEPRSYTLHVELHDSAPPIWRRLQVNSDITLYTLHLAIQGVFGWRNSHLHRFAIGEPFDIESEQFVSEWETEEGVEAGLATTAVRLDETLQEPNDVLEYVYDYGDNWDLQIRLEQVGDLSPDAPVASCIDGGRAAPPEDCGSLRTADLLAGVVSDVAHFDVGEANAGIKSLLYPGPAETFLAEYSFHDGAEFVGLSAEPPAGPESFDLEVEFEALLWFLRRVGDGIKLTQAGYLPPAVAREFRDVLHDDLNRSVWRGNSEANMRQLHEYRLYLHRLGLVRKSRGMLLLTRAGAAASRSPETLWDHLVERFAAAFTANPERRDFNRESIALTLSYAATFGGKLDIDRIALELSIRGWAHHDGSAVSDFDISWGGHSPAVLFWFMGPRDERRWHSSSIRPAAVAIARAAIERGLGA